MCIREKGITVVSKWPISTLRLVAKSGKEMVTT